MVNYASAFMLVLFKLNKLGLLKKVINGRAPEYLITTLDSLRFEHKYSTRTKTLYRLPRPRTEAMRKNILLFHY